MQLSTPRCKSQVPAKETNQSNIKLKEASTLQWKRATVPVVGISLSHVVYEMIIDSRRRTEDDSL